ncbi:MAG: DUF11 domain-containing protein [Erythrobacter sp.]|nr:DUF11 domain-containing protein [Erythrobacter sp.]
MKRTRQLLGAVSALALVAFSVSPAMATGTTAGDSITNSVTVDFQVGGVDQTAVTDSDTFVVDRKIDVTVATVGASANVAAGSTGVVRQFTVTNDSNAAVGYALTVATDAGATFTPTNVVIFDDLNSNGQYDSGEEITFIDSMAEDETRDVWVAFDVPITATNGQSSDIILVANAHEAGSGSIGAEITDTAGANGAGTVETVLADGSGVAGADSDNEGDHSAAHSVTVNAASMSVSKFSTVVWDPVNLTSDPRAIPGARVQYCIAVTNASGATATSVVVDDDLPAEVVFYPDAFGTTGDVMVDGTLSAGQCTGGSEVDGYTTSDTNVNESLSDIAAGQTRTLYFQVTIQ